MARILIIDDEVNMRKSIRRILTQDEHDVLESVNGEEGLKVLEQEQVDLVITDIFMPEQDGIVTIKKMRQMYPDIKIIAISGGGNVGLTSSLQVAKLLGAHRVFTKPLEPEELLLAVEDLL